MWPWLLLIAIALVAVYVLFLRERLKALPAFAALYARLEPIEARLWQRSRTIFTARLIMVASILVEAHDVAAPLLAGVDVNPFIPAEYQKFVPLAGVVIGVVFEWLRKVTAPLPTDGSEA